jgi:hypothetical protein
VAVVKAEEDDLRVSSKYEGGERYLQLNVSLQVGKVIS